MTQDELGMLAAEISRQILVTQKEILNMEEVALYTGLKKSYLYKLTSSRAIPHYKPTGGCCFFKRAEIEDWLTANPVATVADINGQAQAYCMKHKSF